MKKPLVYNLPPNPRYNNAPAISWSDLLAIENNVEKWFKGQRMQTNESMSYGTSVHAQIRHGKLKNIPHGNHPEAVYIFGQIVGRVDDHDDDTLYEYKTGMKLWSAKKASEHGQLFTYAYLIGKNTGTYPKKALLVSLETKTDEDSGIVLTGDKRILEVPITTKDILKIQVRFNKAFEKVQKYQASVSK